MFNNFRTNKSTVFCVILFAMSMGTAQASFLAANTTYDMIIRTGTSCYAAGQDCRNLANGFVDNNTVVNFNGQDYGSSIGGDGLAGIIRFKMDATGENLTASSYNLDQYPVGPPDLFVTWADNPALMTGTIDALGNMTFTPEGRQSISGFFTIFGILPWNIDDSLGIPSPSNAVSMLTTGTSTGQVVSVSGSSVSPISLTGSALNADGAGGWNGVLVSSSNFGEAWSVFSGTQYTEVWDVNIREVSAVPVPAAVWLFGSGLLALAGLNRKRRHLSL